MKGRFSLDVLICLGVAFCAGCSKEQPAVSQVAPAAQSSPAKPPVAAGETVPSAPPKPGAEVVAPPAKSTASAEDVAPPLKPTPVAEVAAAPPKPTTTPKVDAGPPKSPPPKTEAVSVPEKQPVPVETVEKPEAKTPGLSRKEMLKTAGSGVVLVNSFDALGEKKSFGSGCVVGKGVVLTNYHVISSAVTAKVQTLGEGDELLGAALNVIGYRALDDRNDLCLLEVEGLPENLHVFPVADFKKTEKFDQVFAIGHPEGLKFTITSGYVNGLLKGSDLPEQFQSHLRDLDIELIQTDAVIAGGSSGGPLLNEQGEIAGVNTYLINARTTLAVGARHVKELLARPPATAVPLPVPDANVLITRTVAEIFTGFSREHEQFMADIQREQTARNAAALEKIARENNPSVRCIRQCQELVKKFPGKPEAADAIHLCATVLLSTGGRNGRPFFDELLEEVVHDAGLIPISTRVLNSLYSLEYSAELDRYLRSILNGDAAPASKAVAGMALIGTMARGPNNVQPELTELVRDISERFGDQHFAGKTIKEQLQGFIDGLQFAVGSSAPDIVGKDAEDKEFRLSEYRGKVVVLDFWADWCPHCRNMYPHQREFTERMKDRPFIMLGINGDEPDRAQQAIKAGKVTWRSWLDGQDGSIAKDWKIASWPTTYVLDQEGRIQFKDLRGEELEAAVQSLLNESPYPLTQSILPSKAEWKYLTVQEGNRPENWREPDFDDSKWSAGPGPLGYGNVKVQTKLDQATAGARPLVRLFRTQFDLPEKEMPSQLLMRLRYRDGVAVYLNGNEVYRANLTQTAGLDAPATDRDSDLESEGVCLPIDSASLKPAGNRLAVELHGYSAYSTSVLCDLSLGLPPDLAALIPTATAAEKLEICQLISQTGALPGSDAIVKQLQTDKSPAVQFQAAVAAAMNGFPVSIPKLTDKETNESLMQYLVGWNKSAWNVVKLEGYSPPQYQAALRRAKAARALSQLLIPQLRARLASVLDNTLGVAEFRSGALTEAQSTLKKSIKNNGGHPVDVAYLAMVLWRLDKKEDAEKQREKYAKLIAEDKWKDDFSATAVKKELDRTLKE